MKFVWLVDRVEGSTCVATKNTRPRTTPLGLELLQSLNYSPSSLARDLINTKHKGSTPMKQATPLLVTSGRKTLVPSR